ncbi:MAG: hypothetical protein LUH07_01870 [Lachnospiraceae bacterium]|nr:hypothetical protein [Lachnospiraceae bacterium]
MLTKLDQIANQNHLLLLKAIIPHLPANRQKSFSILIKMMEMQNILKFYNRNPGSIRACDTSDSKETSSGILDILADIRNYCDEEDQEMIDQALQTISMIELYSLLAQQEEDQKGDDNYE